MSSDVTLRTIGRVAFLTLNRPKALNALTVGMIEALDAHYRALDTQGLSAIVLQGAGDKAFCAGGDVKAIYDDRETGNTGKVFFGKEYRLNYVIGSLNTPHIALINGIVFGGGAGVSVHGRYRVATEKTLFSMPETMIGLFPDVGASWFLPKLGPLGMYLGLTGLRLKGYQVYASGVATHFVQSDRLHLLKEAIIERGPKALDEFHEALPNGDASLNELKAQVQETFQHTTVEEIFAALEQKGTEWAKETLKELSARSPTSLKVTLRMLQEAPKTREDCFALEYRLGTRFVEKKGGDFFEGVRALLVDKDYKPNWNPPTLEKANADSYFKPLSVEESARLKLH